MLARRFALLLASSVFLSTFLTFPLAAQETSETRPAADIPLTGVVRTSDGSAVPGATMRAIETSSGKAWVSWTDENGKFTFPALPAGHYRLEISQLGFAPATRELDLSPAVQAPVELKMDVATLAAINAPPPNESPAKTETAKARVAAPSTSGTPPSQNQNTAATNNGTPATPGGRPGGRSGGQQGYGRYGQQGGQGGPGQGGGRRSFQQVALNAQNQDNAENPEEEQNQPEQAAQLGQAASTDAVQMIGTVAMGASLDQMGGFGTSGWRAGRPGRRWWFWKRRRWGTDRAKSGSRPRGSGWRRIRGRPRWRRSRR